MEWMHWLSLHSFWHTQVTWPVKWRTDGLDRSQGFFVRGGRVQKSLRSEA
jgi:hypothetical protein